MRVRNSVVLVALALAVAVAAPACGRRPSDSVLMRVADLERDAATDSPVLLLRAEDGSETLRLWIGFAEARAIALEMEGIDPPRPLTHDLLRDAIEKAGARVEEVEITDLRDATFIAELALATESGKVRVDARPSDAIALALRTRSPIRVRRAVIAKAAQGGAMREARAETGLGAAVQAIAGDLADAVGRAEGGGVLVSAVDAGSLAATLGLRRGDVVTRVGRAEVRDPEEFARLAREALSRRRVELTVDRQGDRLRLSGAVD